MRYLLIVLLLAGCGGSDIDCEGRAVIGDSLTSSVADRLDGDVFAYPGLSLTLDHRLYGKIEPPEGYCELVIALGTNRASSEERQIDGLLRLLDAAPHHKCVLPMTVNHFPVYETRALLKKYCKVWVDPFDRGFYPQGADGTHLSGEDNFREFAEIINE